MLLSLFLLLPNRSFFRDTSFQFVFYAHSPLFVTQFILNHSRFYRFRLPFPLFNIRGNNFLVIRTVFLLHKRQQNVVAYTDPKSFSVPTSFTPLLNLCCNLKTVDILKNFFKKKPLDCNFLPKCRNIQVYTALNILQKIVNLIKIYFLRP